TAVILKDLIKGVSVEKIADDLSEKLKIPLDETTAFIVGLEKNLLSSKELEAVAPMDASMSVKKPLHYKFVKLYKVNDLIFKVAFSSEYELYLVHPKFAHLEVHECSNVSFTFSVFTSNSLIFFYVDDLFIGAWHKREVHFFQGKFSMELIQRIHKKEENKWLGVFHASAVSNGEKAVLFLGDSGNGKSTSLALLQANGFTCLADDFVPVDTEKRAVYSFPAAISIKKNSVDTLLPFYPELADAAEFYFKRLQKIVRYLPPNNTDFLSHFPCKDLVFIKYEKESDLDVQKIAKLAAFQQLVPDAWLSPIVENAKVFLDWFGGLNCYQITYSDNTKMIAAVSKIFKGTL
ncbi:MAG: hypothetical protein ACI8VJ_000758, partial [Polaribacter sp.]